MAEIGEPFSEAKRLKGLYSDNTDGRQYEQSTDHRKGLAIINQTKQAPYASVPESKVTSLHEPIQEDEITLEELMGEIQRLVLHEFGLPGRQTPYPAILEPLYQRLYDYHICLKTARKKLAALPKNRLSGHPKAATASLDTLHCPSTRTVDFNSTSKDMLVDSFGTGLRAPSRPSELEAALLSAKQAQARVSDLEHQLSLSRRAHHALLKEHILNLQSAASSPFPGPGAIAAKISATDSKVMESVLAAVAFNARSLTKPSSLGTDGCRNLKISNRGQEPLCSDDANQAIVLPPSTSNIAVAALGSDRSLTGSDPQTMLNEATTRLLCAETELGMLMLVMAQNAEDISGLEEEVSRKQKELTHHRQLFAHLLESIPLGFEAEIQEGQLQAIDLEKRIKALEGDRRLTEKKSQVLEDEVQELMKRLSESRETQEVREQEQQKHAQVLETMIEDLRLELAFQDFKVLELSELVTQNREEIASLEGKQEANEAKKRLQEGTMEPTAEERQHMLDHLEKQHKKKTAALYASLIKAQKTNKRLNKELSTLAVKIVRVVALNDKLSEQVKKNRGRIRVPHEEVTSTYQQPSTAGVVPSSSSSTVDHAFESQKDLKARITALEIQIDELTSNLRLKEIELEQAQEETERLTLKLEEDLALQKQAHQEEMQRFSEEKKLQAQRERTCTAASVTVFQNMATKLQNELMETQEKLRDTTLCWGHTKELLQKCEQSYRRRKKDLEETTKNLHEVEETVVKLSDAIGLLEMEKEANIVLVRTLEQKDREIRDMEYRLRVLEEERE
ncbi:hypothetical protein BGZ68_010486 [Mortierella alpina]|nr:hypothetical protein BGZ68_010486 [Mortierella alpina]